MDIQNTTDHDLLVELRTEMKGMREDVKGLREDTKDTITDHEMRIRMLERGYWKLIGASAAVSSTVTFLGSLLAKHYGV